MGHDKTFSLEPPGISSPIYVKGSFPNVALHKGEFGYCVRPPSNTTQQAYDAIYVMVD